MATNSFRHDTKHLVHKLGNKLVHQNRPVTSEEKRLELGGGGTMNTYS